MIAMSVVLVLAASERFTNESASGPTGTVSPCKTTNPLFDVGFVSSAFTLARFRPIRSASVTAFEDLDANTTRFAVRLGAFAEAIEFGELTSDLIDSTGTVVGEIDIEAIERERVGIHLQLGNEIAALDVALFGESFADDLYDGAGLRIGLSGTPRLMPERAITPILDYTASVALSVLTGDVPVVDLNTGAIVGKVEQDVAYLEEQLRVGVGVDVYGAQMVVGGIASFFQGAFEANDDTSPLDGESGDLDGENFGGYVRLGYRGRDIPLYASITGYVGDYEGAEFRIGFRF